MCIIKVCVSMYVYLCTHVHIYIKTPGIILLGHSLFIKIANYEIYAAEKTNTNSDNRCDLIK